MGIFEVFAALSCQYITYNVTYNQSKAKNFQWNTHPWTLGLCLGAGIGFLLVYATSRTEGQKECLERWLGLAKNSDNPEELRSAIIKNDWMHVLWALILWAVGLITLEAYWGSMRLTHVTQPLA